MIVKGSVRYQKNWLRKDKRTQERVPKTHIRKVTTGRDGSSAVDTVVATCLMGEFSSDCELDGRDLSSSRMETVDR